MQSGISASKDLHQAFKTLQSTSSQRALLATISNEQIIPGSTIPATGDFLSDLSSLAPHIKPNEALYILLRSGEPNGSLIAITYVPNAAPVRQKMLFASTRLTLTRELGTESFGESFVVTEGEELTREGWEKHRAHGEAANPLTEQERDLEGIKEAEALEGRGTRGHGLTQGGRIAIRFDQEVADALKGLKEGGTENLVQLFIDGSSETLKLGSVSSASAAALATSIGAEQPRFSFYRHNDPTSSIVFISTCPSGSKLKDRMLYAASRTNVITLAQTEGSLTIAKRLEATNPIEVTEQTITDEFKVTEAEEKKAFARPKRPGKR